MHVNRSRFLLLTAALATAACGGEKSESQPDEAKAAKDAKASADAKTGEDTKTGEAKAAVVDPTKAPSTPATASAPGGGTATAPTPVDEAAAPSPVVESTANWD